MSKPRACSAWRTIWKSSSTIPEARSAMDQAVDALPESLRTVFLLRDIEGLSTLETAEVLNLSEMAVKTRLSRARMRLREQLTAYYGERMARRRSIEEEVV